MKSIEGSTVNPGDHLKGITLIAWLMIVFGLAEGLTGFGHRFFSLVTSETTFATLVGAGIGLLYLTSGLLTLTQRKRAATGAIFLLILDVLGRAAMASMGLYPIRSFLQLSSMVVGTAIVAFFAVYIGMKRKFLK
jgi:hypothetical protein